MNITKSKLRKIINEELSRVLKEDAVETPSGVTDLDFSHNENMGWRGPVAKALKGRLSALGSAAISGRDDLGALGPLASALFPSSIIRVAKGGEQRSSAGGYGPRFSISYDISQSNGTWGISELVLNIRGADADIDIVAAQNALISLVNRRLVADPVQNEIATYVQDRARSDSYSEKICSSAEIRRLPTTGAQVGVTFSPRPCF